MSEPTPAETSADNSADASLRDLLRSAKSPNYELPVFDTDAAPSDPIALFRDWLAEAIDAGVSRVTAMTLATASWDGAPTARTLLLKDVTPEGLWFASLASGPKGAQIAENPRAALVFYWREQGRQVRVEGRIRVGPRDVSERDFVARHPNARARAIAGEQSAPMPDAATVEHLVGVAAAAIERDKSTVPDDWNAYVVEPHTVEFWQAADGHNEVRLGYRRDEGEWMHELLWP